jgi:hypothetical protein
MSARHILIPLGEFCDHRDAEYLWELMLCPESEWSERERKRVERVIDEGLLWSASREDDPERDQFSLHSTDGQGRPVMLTLPNYVSERHAAEMMGHILDRLDD